MSITRNRVELSHRLTILHNWAFDPERDTISGLTEKQAAEVIRLINEAWMVIDRRAAK